MLNEPHVNILDLAIGLASAMDMVSPALIDHHKAVAYIAFNLADEIGLQRPDRNRILLAGLLHDAGALTLKERLGTPDFELENPHRHSFTGYCFFKDFEPLSEIAPIIKYHHVGWDQRCEIKMPFASHIVHLADRISVLVDRRKPLYTQAESILEIIKGSSGRVFMPELVSAFESASRKESFWMGLLDFTGFLDSDIKSGFSSVRMGLKGLTDFADLFRMIIDFRSRYTATHSYGVGVVGEELARLAGFSKNECALMRVAGYLHDLGKLGIPTEVLEKPGPHTPEESFVMRSHVSYTNRILRTISGLETINLWASLHHEMINGRGYPFHYDGNTLPLGARILAVADVFTALNESRPYRPAMSEDVSYKLISDMAEDGTLDLMVTNLILHNYEYFLRIRSEAFDAALRDYEDYRERISGFDGSFKQEFKHMCGEGVG